MMSKTEKTNCFAIRRLNPFQGVVQIIHTEYGRCLSVDGKYWQIQLLVKINTGWGSLNASKTEQSYYRYGVWQEAAGLMRMPLAPHLSVDDLSYKCEKLIELIKLHINSIPFLLIDNYEYWLLDDSDSRPLVLLRSDFENPVKLSVRYQKWTAKMTFRPSESEFLEKQIQERAGYKNICRWIERGVNGNDIESGKFYPAEDFPELLIREDWQELQSMQRVQDYIDLISPMLLTLQNLRRNTRAQMEKKIFLQAEAVVNNHRLYPETINSKLIKAALVQRRLQEAI